MTGHTLPEFMIKPVAEKALNGIKLAIFPANVRKHFILYAFSLKIVFMQI